MIIGMGLILALWGVLALVLGGLGRLLVRGVHLHGGQSWRLDQLIWLGWAAVILVLQLWHLLLPVNGWALGLLVLLGSVGWLGVEWRAWPGRFRPRTLGWSFATAAVVYALWLANRAGGSIAGVGDAGLYHVGVIRWLNEAPIVPGLGNLHGRLAFNNASFLYYALLESGPLARQSFHVAGGFLLLITGLASLWQLMRMLLTPMDLDVVDSMVAMLYPFVLYLAFIYSASTSPDLIVTLLMLVIGGALFRLLTATSAHADAARLLFLVGVLSAAGITIKLSLIVFSALAALAALTRYWQLAPAQADRRAALVPLARTALAGGLIVLPWIARNLLFSGYFIYPALGWHIDLPWRVPPAQMIDEARWIRSWARLPWVHHSEVLGNLAWVTPWLQTARAQTIEVVLPLGLAALAWLLLAVRRPLATSRGAIVLWLGTLLGALLFWWVTAPAIRFAGGLLWLLAASGMALLLSPLPVARLRLAGVAVTALVLFVFVFQARTLGVTVPPGLGRFGLHPLPDATVQAFHTDSGLIVNVPERGYSCWAAPLPCTPYPTATLRTLTPGDWRSGFVQPEDRVQITWPPAGE